MEPKPPAQFANDPLFLEVMADALAIQERFAAEPVYAKTGKGFLKSAGVAELKQIKAAKSRHRRSHHKQAQPNI